MPNFDNEQQNVTSAQDAIDNHQVKEIKRKLQMLKNACEFAKKSGKTLELVKH